MLPPAFIWLYGIVCDAHGGLSLGRLTATSISLEINQIDKNERKYKTVFFNLKDAMCITFGAKVSFCSDNGVC